MESLPVVLHSHTDQHSDQHGGCHQLYKYTLNVSNVHCHVLVLFPLKWEEFLSHICESLRFHRCFRPYAVGINVHGAVRSQIGRVVITISLGFFRFLVPPPHSFEACHGHGVESCRAKGIASQNTPGRQCAGNNKATMSKCLNGIGRACRRKPTRGMRLERG